MIAHPENLDTLKLSAESCPRMVILPWELACTGVETPQQRYWYLNSPRNGARAA